MPLNQFELNLLLGVLGEPGGPSVFVGRPLVNKLEMAAAEMLYPAPTYERLPVTHIGPESTDMEIRAFIETARHNVESTRRSLGLPPSVKHSETDPFEQV